MNNFRHFTISTSSIDEPRVIAGYIDTLPIIYLPDDEPEVLWENTPRRHYFLCWDDELEETLKDVMFQILAEDQAKDEFAVGPYVITYEWKYVDKPAP